MSPAAPSPTSFELERQRNLVDQLNNQAYDERYNNTSLTLKLAEDALTHARRIHYTEGEAWALRNLGIGNAILGNAEKALEYLSQALGIFEQLENMRGLGLTLSNMGTVYQQSGQLDKAVEYLWRSLRYLQLIPDLAFFYAQTLANIGSLFGELEQYELAKEYHEKALKIHQEIGSQRGMFFSLISLGTYYQRLRNYEEAERLFNTALDIASELGEEDLIVRTLLAHAQLLNESGRHQEALVKLEQGERLASEIKNTHLLLSGLVAMAESQIELGLIEKAQKTLEKVEAIRNETREGVVEYFLPEIRAKLSEKLGDYEGAYKHYKEYTQKRLAIQRALSQNTLTTLERILREDIIGAKREASADIGVARRIQEVLLHGESELKEVFPNSVYWSVPRSLVSGDFLWVGRGKEGAQILVVVDASGAGVSAAILSTIAHTLLYEIITIRGVTDPGRILSQLHKSLLDLLYPPAKKANPEIEAMQAEGFQVGICTVLPSAGEVHYAGAHIPLWIYNPLVGWEQLNPDRRLIGQRMEEEKTPRLYTSNIIPVEKQWVILFMTDGWERQIRASDGKRYGRSAIRDFLNHHPPVDLREWMTNVQKEFEQWRGGAMLTDDVLMVAVRI
ncbi:MAG: tetratricopeptide repeat protein [Bacteroidia bacterium]|nr:tetratricopeptide repeat protein [Bacteroidia bacterium]MDW8134108.1 tetratricopeptide repeat protein [Bacteroidia bacterium]